MWRGGVCRLTTTLHAEEAEEEAAEDGLDAEHEAGGGGERKAKHMLGREIAESSGVPDVQGVAEDRRAEQKQ